MQRLELEQKLGHKLSGQQIQFVKLLQIPTIALNDYITKEMALNPMLEDPKEVSDYPEEAVAVVEAGEQEDYHFNDYYPNDLYKGRYRHDLQFNHDAWTAATVSLQESLVEQLHLLPLREVDYIIGTQLIGSLDADGYLHIDLEVVVQDLYVLHYLTCSLEEVKAVLAAIQGLDPAGIAARNLQECLWIQLHRKNADDPVVQLAKQVISQCFTAFVKKQYDAIVKKLVLLDTHLLKKALSYIARLNPKPGHYNNNEIVEFYDCLTPDFIVIENHGKLIVELIHYPIHRIRLNKKYLTMLETYEQKSKQDIASRQMVDFLKKKLEDAKWFMESLSQRSQTLLKTMQAILDIQYAFFMESEEPDKLRPMILQDIANRIDMDISTVSRIVNQKSVQGRFGIYPLKYFFSEGISRTTGEEVSNKAVKSRILELIKHEDKQHPYPDGDIEALLIAEGYQIARRTVAKYREQLHLPVARLRKSLV